MEGGPDAPPGWWDEEAAAEAQRLGTEAAGDGTESAGRSEPVALVAGGAEDGGVEEGEAEEEAADPYARTEWTEADLVGSEWKMGIMWEFEALEKDPKPQETWIRFKADGELEWGINARGTYSLDGQFLSFTRDFAFGWGGKRLFACKLSRVANEVRLRRPACG